MWTMKTILITGATAGIGRHAALELVRRGHHVIATGRREKALASLLSDAEALKTGRIDVVRLDITNNEEVETVRALVDGKLTAGRGIDVLVNNAGYGQMGPVELVSDADLRKQFETNVFGLMNVTRAFLPKMRERGEGRIINIGSIGGRVTFPLMGVYSSTKYAVESLSDGLRLELAPFGIDVSIVEPGPIRTEFSERAMETIDPATLEGNAYAPVIRQAERVQKKFESQSAGPEVTTNAIVHAAFARRPRIRYVVPFKSGVMLAVIALLPTRFVDAVMRLIAGLTKKNLAASSSSDSTSRKAA